MKRKKKESRVLGGTKRVFKSGGSIAIFIPGKFAEAHGIKAGDEVAYAADHIMKIIPMPEEKYDTEETTVPINTH